MSDCTQPFLVFFYDVGCPSSSSMTTVFRDTQAHFGDRLPCISLNIRSAVARLNYSNVTVAPTLVLMHDKAELWRCSGLIHASEILSAIEAHL